MAAATAQLTGHPVEQLIPAAKQWLAENERDSGSEIIPMKIVKAPWLPDDVVIVIT